jgi:hypothetical protein
MTQHLANSLRDHLERNALAALEMERRAGLPNATVAGILRGRHPRPETMSALLASVPTNDAELLLLAYLRDDCPDDWEQRIHVEVMPVAHQVSESTTTYFCPPGEQAPKPQIDRALAALTQAASGDTELRDWIIQTAQVLNLI